jgi:hypothetical protein
MDSQNCWTKLGYDHVLERLEMNRIRFHLLVATVAAALLPSVAGAEEHFTHHEFHDRDVAHFRGHDLDVWRAGHWAHEWRNGRFGWWWFAGGIWYFYDAPVYPYPTTLSGVTFVEPEVVTQPAAPSGVPAYYYCDNPAGYYPYVTTCTVPFRPVAPPPPAPAAAPSVPSAGYAPPPNATPAPAPR